MAATPKLDPGYRDVYSPDGTRVARVTHSGDGETFDTALVIEEADGTLLQVVDDVLCQPVVRPPPRLVALG